MTYVWRVTFKNDVVLYFLGKDPYEALRSVECYSNRGPNTGAEASVVVSCIVSMVRGERVE